MIVRPEYLADRPAAGEKMTQTPADFADPPITEEGALGLVPDGEPHDLLSELLGSVHLRGERIAEYAPHGAFSIDFGGAGALHIVESGEFELGLDGDERSERVRRGDVILLPRGDAHHMANVKRRAAHRRGGPEQVEETAYAGEPVRWLCGTFMIGDSDASHLLASLPAVIMLRGARDQALEWLEVSRRMLLIEMQSPSQGSVVMVARILDLLFIQILRAWAAGEDATPNWLAGALDPQIGPALSAIHTDPGRDWTVEDLARSCSLSRSAFAERFAARVGKPPASYLANVRLDAAATLLRDTPAPVGLVADKVGYASEAAFSRAFRNRYGTPPARWRREARAH
jgi:AraC-like DNA-binding protein